MIYIIDTYPWIEYFNGTKKGQVLNNLFEIQGNKFVTMECNLSELLDYALRHDVDFSYMYGVVKRNSVILPVLRPIWLSAAKIKYELRKRIDDIGLIDAILVAKQKELKCKIVTGDPHFKTLKDILFLG